MNYLDMSDEEIDKLTINALEEDLANSSKDEEETTVEDTEEESIQENEEEIQDTEESEETEEAVDEVTEQTEVVQQPDEDVPTEESQKDITDNDSPSKEDELVDYKAAYEKILAPFKANGKQIQVDSIEDAITLMQMGANYNQKMAALKPHLKTIKMLENQGLLDEAKLNQLIEVGKGNPNAIKKVVADSKLDTYEFNAEEDSKYVPKNYSVNDSELELDLVIKELQEDPVFNRTAQIVSSGWDAESKQAVVNNPVILKTIHEHVASGKYDKVSSEVERLRMLGKIPSNVAFVDAYGAVAKHMDEQEIVAKPYVPKPVKEPVRPKDQLRDTARKAIAPTKKVTTTKSLSVDPLSMSDDEFLNATKDLFKTI